MLITVFSSIYEISFDLYTRPLLIISQAINFWRFAYITSLLPSLAACEMKHISFTVNIGFIPPIYYTALKC